MTWPIKRPRGRPSKAKTWLRLWMDVHGYTEHELARMIFTSRSTVCEWMYGHPVSRHYGRLLRARWPDCPVPAAGGPVPLLSEKMPINARTKEMMRMLMRKMGVLKDRPIWPVALAEARALQAKLQPKQDAGSGGQVDGGAV